MKKYLTMDIGGTFIKYSIMDEDFHEEHPKSVPTERDPEQFLKQLLLIIAENTEPIDGIAISMGGFIDPETGLNTDYSVGANFTRYNLKEKLYELTGYRVAVENDSNCAALAELHLGAGRDCKDFCMVTVGTGIGGAIIHNRELFRGRNFKAGEFGFSLIGKETKDSKWNYKAAAATSTLVRRVSEALGQKVDGIYIFDHLDQQIIREIYEEWLEDLAIVIGNLAVCMDPEKVIIGGAISIRERFINDLKNRVYDIHQHLDKYTKIEACTLGNNAGKIGALLQFFTLYGNI
ncbi:ROK family protein [Lachnoclostridium sp.]|uniref:ROK family protein n=1 Tax=Lachnoclostridium sp. TaxID=2028282 RepID=UPI0026CC8BFA|nr:ROK family protein [Lachnoclostridium sp.]